MKFESVNGGNIGNVYYMKKSYIFLETEIFQNFLFRQMKPNIFLLNQKKNFN